MDKRIKGFTTMELLISITIFGFVSILSAEIFMRSLDFWHTTMLNGELCFTARQAMMRMERELVNASIAPSAKKTSHDASIPAPPDVLPNNSSIRFYLPQDSDANSYIVDGQGVTEWNTINYIDYKVEGGLLVRIKHQINPPDERSILATNVSQVSFSDCNIDPTNLRDDEVRISLSMSKETPLNRTVTLNIDSIVRLRN